MIRQNIILELAFNNNQFSYDICLGGAIKSHYNAGILCEYLSVYWLTGACLQKYSKNILVKLLYATLVLIKVP